MFDGGGRLTSKNNESKAAEISDFTVDGLLAVEAHSLDDCIRCSCQEDLHSSKKTSTLFFERF